MAKVTKRRRRYEMSFNVKFIEFEEMSLEAAIVALRNEANRLQEMLETGAVIVRDVAMSDKGRLEMETFDKAVAERFGYWK